MSTPTTSDVKFQNPHIGNTSCLIQSSIAPGEDTFEKGNCCEEDHLDSKHEQHDEWNEARMHSVTFVQAPI